MLKPKQQSIDSMLLFFFFFFFDRHLTDVESLTVRRTITHFPPASSRKSAHLQSVSARLSFSSKTTNSFFKLNQKDRTLFLFFLVPLIGRTSNGKEGNRCDNRSASVNEQSLLFVFTSQRRPAIHSHIRLNVISGQQKDVPRKRRVIVQIMPLIKLIAISADCFDLAANFVSFSRLFLSSFVVLTHSLIVVTLGDAAEEKKKNGERFI